jgi:hypothetical protein
MAQVYRPQAGNTASAGRYELVCENKLTVGAVGINKFPVPASDQCVFKDNDVVGWYHPGKGVIEYAPKTLNKFKVWKRCDFAPTLSAGRASRFLLV